MAGSVSKARSILADVAWTHFAEGSTEEVSTQDLLDEARAQGAFDGEEIDSEVRARGEADLLRSVMESLLDDQGRHVVVSIRRVRRQSPVGEQLDLLGRVWKRADALLPGEQRKSPRDLLRAQVLGLFRKAAASVLSPERARRAVAFLDALFAEQERDDAGRVA